MEPSAEPARPSLQALPGLSTSSRSPDPFASYRTPAAAASTDRYYGAISPSNRSSSVVGESVQLPSLRTLVNPLLLGSRAPDASPVPVTRLPSLSGFDQGLPADRPVDRPINGHGYANREESQAPASVSQSQSVSSAAPAYSPYTTAAPAVIPAVANGHPRVSLSDSKYRGPRQDSISSGNSAVSEHPSPSDEMAETPTVRVKRRLGDATRGPARSARCVGQQDVPGEGLCYVYEDGSYCRTIIDGEPVNPSWGVTKAGKPRKRLAQACLTCREKKIKCEPGVPKCAQCSRARRACRGGLAGPSSNADGVKVDLSESLISIKQHSEDPFSARTSPSQQTQRNASPSLQGFAKPHTFAEIGKPGAPDASRKRRYRSSSDERDLQSALAPRVAADGAEASAMHAIVRSTLELDPYEEDPALTKHLLDLFFAYVNSSTYAIFPKEPFMRWVMNDHRKTTDDKLVIYSLLVMGNVFSDDPEWRHVEKQLLDICNTGLQRRIGKFTIQMCLSRLYVGLAHFARGRHEEAWDWCGAFLRALSALKLNLEEGVACDESEAGLFGFSARMVEECRLRTFWAGFLMDRYNGFSGGTLFTIGLDDVCVRLPCSKAAYDAGQPLDTPVFDGGHIEDIELLRNISPMGYHSLVSAIWGDVWTVTTRAARKPTNMRLDDYEAFYNKTNDRLEEWLSRLPTELRFTEENFFAAIDAGYAGTFVGMHALHQATIMRLNRYARHASLPPHILARNVARANTAARHLLTNIIAPVTKHARCQRLGPHHPFAFATPFPGYAVLIATDILSAGGLASDIASTIEAVSNGLAIVDEIASFWYSARAQQKGVAGRLRYLAETAMGQGSPLRNVDGKECWRLEKPLETNFAGHDDVVYGASDEVYFSALRGKEPLKRRDMGMSMVMS